MVLMAIRLFALVAYAAFGGAFVYFIGFCGGVGVPKTVDGGAELSTGAAVAVDLLLVAFFGVVHSLMARDAFKRAWTRVIPAAAERSAYVLVASIQMALLMWLWRPLPRPVLWSTSGAAALALMAAQLVGWGLVLLSSFLIDHFEMFGLRQAFGRARPDHPMETPLLYRLVRHPLYLGLLIGLWAPSTMSAGHLLLSASLTAYVLVGVRYEERDLLRRFGDDYRRYREQVPMLLPIPGRRLSN
jgi:methanethiol S-methyltransferase